MCFHQSDCSAGWINTFILRLTTSCRTENSRQLDPLPTEQLFFFPNLPCFYCLLARGIHMCWKPSPYSHIQDIVLFALACNCWYFESLSDLYRFCFTLEPEFSCFQEDGTASSPAAHSCVYTSTLFGFMSNSWCWPYWLAVGLQYLDLFNQSWLAVYCLHSFCHWHQNSLLLSTLQQTKMFTVTKFSSFLEVWPPPGHTCCILKKLFCRMENSLNML